MTQPACQQPSWNGARLLPTTARWHNHTRKYRDLRGERCEEPVKRLAHTGELAQFRYGTDTPSTWPRCDLQPCQLATPESGLIVIDTDYPGQYAATRTGQLLDRRHALTTRDERYHVWVDARAVPRHLWPVQGAIQGGDVKSNGWVPLPGSRHWTGARYEPVPGAVLIPAWPGLIAAIRADLADERERREAWLRQLDAELAAAGYGPRSRGGGKSAGYVPRGHDTWVAGKVLGMVLRGLTEEQCYAEWARIAVPLNPDDPFTWRADFKTRHYRTAVRKAAEIREQESAWALALAGDGAR